MSDKKSDGDGCLSVICFVTLLTVMPGRLIAVTAGLVFAFMLLSAMTADQ